jgi:hypothetical protein
VTSHVESAAAVMLAGAVGVGVTLLAVAVALVATVWACYPRRLGRLIWHRTVTAVREHHLPEESRTPPPPRPRVRVVYGHPATGPLKLHRGRR